jgi:hypothetical protein
MDEAAARRVLLARAYDTATPSPRWDDDDRAWVRQATARAVGEQATLEEVVTRRAELVTHRLAGREASIARLLHALEWRGWIVLVTMVVALVIGLATDALSAGAKVNVLAPPLLATLAWNLGVYLLLVVRMARAGRSGRSGIDGRDGGAGRRSVDDRSADRSPGFAVTLFGTAFGSLVRRSRAARLDRPVLATFLGDWSRASAPLQSLRLAQLMHLAAATFAAGLLAGLYLRGLVFEYRAGWESTFLDAGQVRSLLGLVLGPASALTGIRLPDAGALEAIRFTAGPGEQAAGWLHLHATTIALWVIVPRLALAAQAARQARRLATDFPLPLDDAYFRNLVRARGEAIRVPVMPCSYQVPAASLQGLTTLLVDALSAEVALEVAPRAEADAEADADATADADKTANARADTDADTNMSGSSPELVIALFNLSATPERETHAAFLDSLAQRLPADVPLQAVVDETAFRSRFAHEPRRLDERRTAWRRLLAESDHEPLFIALGAERGPSGALDAATTAQALRERLESAAQRHVPGTRTTPSATP